MRNPGPGRGQDDPYRVLGVNTEASRQDITRAYRRAASAAHPDTRPQDPDATARFQAVTDAYDLLKDAGRRAEYDRQHPRADTAARWTGLPPLAGRPYGRPVWAGPVHIEPPEVHVSGNDELRPWAECLVDPPVILGPPRGRRGNLPW
jgi:DnaJ-like protein